LRLFRLSSAPALFLSLSFSRSLRVLLSFPTRRSSDLGGMTRGQAFLACVAHAERCVIRLVHSRALHGAAKTRFLPHNSAFGLRGGAQLSVRCRGVAVEAPPHDRTNATNPASGAAAPPSRPHRTRTTERSRSGVEVPRHEVELQAHLAHLFVVDHRGVPGVIDVQL